LAVGHQGGEFVGVDHGWGDKLESGTLARRLTRNQTDQMTRPRATPQMMAILRNIIVFLFKKNGSENAAAATRHYVCHPGETLEILSTPI
jgi:hypothetical protein